MTFDDPTITAAPAPNALHDSALLRRLEAMEARILQMASDAQESELNRQTEASEYERVIRQQRLSAVAAQSITDALVVQVQEMHYTSLAREEEVAAVLEASTPDALPTETEFMRDFQLQTASLQRTQQTVDQLTLLLGRSQAATEALIAAAPQLRQPSPSAAWPQRPDPPHRSLHGRWGRVNGGCTPLRQRKLRLWITSARSPHSKRDRPGASRWRQAMTARPC